MLHIIDSFPVSSALDNAVSGDTVIFTENAVLAVKQENMAAESFSQKTLVHINLCVRKADLLLRDISKSELLRGVVIIDEMQFENVLLDDFALKSCN